MPDLNWAINCFPGADLPVPSRSGAGIVGQQEPEGLTLQHLAVHGRNLVWQRLHEAGVDCEIRVKMMRYVTQFGDIPFRMPAKRAKAEVSLSRFDVRFVPIVLKKSPQKLAGS